MRKRVKIAVAVLVAAVLAVIGWGVLRPQEREPVYQGKRLSAWLRECWLAEQRKDIPEGNRAKAAIRQIGTTGIPTLVRMLRENEPAWLLLCDRLDGRTPSWVYRVGARGA